MIPINIAIADRTYRVKVEKEDEEMVRKTLKIINDKIIEFKTNFAAKDMQDYISMVLIWLANEKSKTNPVTENELNNSLDDLLKILK